MPLHSWLFSRNIVEKVGGWDESLSRAANCDFHYSSRAILASAGVKFCAGAKSYYRSNIKFSMSRLRSPEVWDATLRCHEFCLEHILKKEDSPRTRHACATHLQRLIYEAYPDEPEIVWKAERVVQSLGGAELKPGGGRVFIALANVLGWKAAKRIQKLSYRFR